MMTSKKSSDTNLEHLINKFNKEFLPTFETVVTAEGGGAEGEEVPDSLNYRQLGELLFTMGYLSGNTPTENQERTLLNEMW